MSGLVIFRECPADGVCLHVGADGDRCKEPELLWLRREWVSLFRTSIRRFEAAALPGGGFLVSLLVVVFVSSILIDVTTPGPPFGMRLWGGSVS
jgi:hypothetical protein